MHIKNIFRRQTKKALKDKMGYHNPCSYCWRLNCHDCMMFELVDFALVVRSDPELTQRFENIYKKIRGIDNTPHKNKEKKINVIDKDNKSDKSDKSCQNN